VSPFNERVKYTTNSIRYEFAETVGNREIIIVKNYTKLYIWLCIVLGEPKNILSPPLWGFLDLRSKKHPLVPHFENFLGLRYLFVGSKILGEGRTLARSPVKSLLWKITLNYTFDCAMYWGSLENLRGRSDPS
jgi:hypothetical protein